MADYTKNTGVDGSMMIRDTGTNVEFWVTSGNNTTYTSSLQYTVVANGSYSATTDYDAGQGWKKLRTVNVRTDQTVSFTVDTNTSGIGGPTTLTAVINRSSIPDAPDRPTLTGITATSVYATFADNDNGGLTIDSRQLSYGTTTAASTTIISSDGSTTITGLAKGTTYYVKARVHNSKGYSAWTATNSFKTLIEPPAPSAVVISEVKQSTAKTVFTSNGDGGSAILEWQLAYGTDPTTPQKTAYSLGTLTVTGLLPGVKHYFWARGRNSVGWGPYSAVRSATTVAGVRYKVGEVWVTAVPYVKVGGVWKPALPWVKIAGMWKETG